MSAGCVATSPPAVTAEDTRTHLCLNTELQVSSTYGSTYLSDLIWTLLLTCTLTWVVFADEVVFHVAAVVVPLVEISPAQTRRRSWLMVHDNAGLASTGRFVEVPVPTSSAQLVKPHAL